MKDTVVYEPPRRTEKSPEDVVLTGLLFAWRNGQPVLVHVIGSLQFHLFLFDSAEKLREELASIGAAFDSIKQVDDGPEFLASIPPEIVVALNLHHTKEGKVRYTQVLR